MAEITASLVKELREMTDAPMMDCKKALSEVDGDLQKAEELLRVKFGNKASKVSSRVAAEGLIAIAISNDGKQGAILETNSETDFCAKNDEFVSFTQKVANAILDSNPADIDALKSVSIDGGKHHFIDDGWEMYDTMEAKFKFGNNKTNVWDGKSRNNYDTYGGGRNCDLR